MTYLAGQRVWWWHTQARRREGTIRDPGPGMIGVQTDAYGTIYVHEQYLHPVEPRIGAWGDSGWGDHHTHPAGEADG